MSKHQWYFIRQKLLGLAILVGSFLLGIYTGEGTILVWLFPLGGYLLLTKKMIIMDKYFFEMEEKKLEKLKKERELD